MGEKTKADFSSGGEPDCQNDTNQGQQASNPEDIGWEGFNGIREGKHGVVKLVYGNYDLYVAFRQLGVTSEKARYRVYVPSFAGRNGTVGGFSVWVKSFEENGEVLNESYLNGAAREYIRRTWYPNLALLCPVLTGPVPVVHNTTVEVSFKNKKHHENLGLLAKQRMGGMGVAEYVTLAAREAPVEAKRVRILMEALRKEGLNPQPHRKRCDGEDSKSDRPKKKKKTFLEEAKLTNTIKANATLDLRVFKPKCGAKPNPEPNDGREEKHES